MIVIGLLGPAGAGKSTVAQHLIDKYGAKKYSLAGPLKSIAREFGFTEEQLYGTQEQKEAIDPRYGMSCRQFLQKLGTEGCRKHLGEDVWVNALLRSIRGDAARITAPPIAVIDDVRFINEVSAIQRIDRDYLGLNGYVWKLFPPVDETAKLRSVGAGAHRSEQEWFNAGCDATIAPQKRGIPELLEIVDKIATTHHLFPTRRELPQ